MKVSCPSCRLLMNEGYTYLDIYSGDDESADRVTLRMLPVLKCENNHIILRGPFSVEFDALVQTFFDDLHALRKKYDGMPE